jgi:ADP-heptose:LPS heptosyltransferase
MITNSLLLMYCDLLGDYLIFRHVMESMLPLLRQRFQSVVWACNPGVAQLSQTLDPHWQPFVILAPVAEGDWKRLTLKRLPKLLLHKASLLQQMKLHKLPIQVQELWCPSVAPFEDNVITALCQAHRKLGRRLESWNLDILQRLFYTETFDVGDFRRFVMHQHVAFFEQALHVALPALSPKPLKQLPTACFHPDLTRLLQNRPYVLVCPESAGAYKEWPPDHFASLIDQLLQAKPGLTVVIAGQKAEVHQAIVKALDPNLPVISAVGQTTVLQLLGLVQQSRLVVCNDSFPLHAANALGVPMVAVTNGQFEGRYYPYPAEARFSHHQFIQPALNGPLSSVPPAQVLSAVIQLL